MKPDKHASVRCPTEVWICMSNVLWSPSTLLLAKYVGLHFRPQDCLDAIQRPFPLLRRPIPLSQAGCHSFDCALVVVVSL